MAGRKPKARYLQVRAWWDFQHYPEKVEQGWQPPWIKAYTQLLDDYEYNELSELNRGRIHRIWLLAARLDNKIPWDEKYVGKVIKASPSFRLLPFIHNGMLLEWAENATVRPPKRPRIPRNQAGTGLDGVYTGSMPDKKRREEKENRENQELLAGLEEHEVVLGPEGTAPVLIIPTDLLKDVA